MRALVLVGVIACGSSARAPIAQQPPPTAEPHADAPPKPPALRLPGDVRPTRYALDLTVIPDAPRANGTMAIDVEVVRPTRVVWLNATELEVGTARIDDRPARVIAGGADFVGLVADRELRPGAARLELAFTAPIDPTKSRGLYSEQESSERYAYTFFEPIDARRVFPCFDEPIYKVPWQLTFHVKQGHVALANAPVVKETPETGGMKRVELAPSKPLPSYLVAFVVGPFEVVDAGLAGRAKTPLRFIIPKGRAGELRYAKEVTPRVVAALEDYFDMDYPYGKLDVAVVPRFWGTMEHPGIVAMGQPLTLIRPDQETRTRKLTYANILAHELGHYWFGDFVTLAWWDDTWLNEALGEWLDMIITDAVEPSWRFRDYRIGLATNAMASDEALSTDAIRRPVETREAIEASFDGAITYAKGASVLRMFEASVGVEPWRAFIRGYLRAHAWGNAAADDLLGAVRDQLGAPIEAGLRSFLDQPGVPRIDMKLACTAQGAKLVLHQQRALPAGVTDPATKLWKLPVCVRYGDAKAARACTMLDAADGELALDSCPKWLLPNADALGYHRSVVDPVTAKAMFTPGSAIAKIAKPTAAEKLMLVADLRAMVDRDELAVDKLLELVPLIAADPDERVAVAAFGAAAIRSDALDDAYVAKAKRYYTKTFGAAATRLGWARGAKDSEERHELRRAVLPAVAIEIPALRTQAEALAGRWLADHRGIEDDLVDEVLATASAHGTMPLFDKVLAAAKAAQDRTEKQRLLATLGGFRDRAVAQRALELVKGTELDLRDSLAIVYGLLGRRETRDLALAFVTENLDGMLARMRDDEASWFLGALAGNACTAERRAAFAALVEPRARKYGGGEVAVRRGLETSAQCVANATRQLPAVKRFLDRY